MRASEMRRLHTTGVMSRGTRLPWLRNRWPKRYRSMCEGCLWGSGWHDSLPLVEAMGQEHQSQVALWFRLKRESKR